MPRAFGSSFRISRIASAPPIPPGTVKSKITTSYGSPAVRAVACDRTDGDGHLQAAAATDFGLAGLFGRRRDLQYDFFCALLTLPFLLPAVAVV